jgi:hypothetical protein
MDCNEYNAADRTKHNIENRIKYNAADETGHNRADRTKYN